MMSYRPADIVLVRFLFTDESHAKARPALVLSNQSYNKGRNELICAAITSNVARLLPGDHLVNRWQEAGLILPSVVTGIVRTILQTMVFRKLGVLPETDMAQYQARIGAVLGFGER